MATTPKHTQKKKPQVEKSEQQKLQEAAEVIQRNKIQREQLFQQELAKLCQKYGVSIASQILITAQ